MKKRGLWRWMLVLGIFLSGTIPAAGAEERGIAAPVQIIFSAQKTLDGHPPEDGAFRFRLLAEDGRRLQEAENEGSTVTFLPVSFGESGTYRFFLKEAAERGKERLCDRAVYTLTVTVTEDFRAEISCERNGKPYMGTPVFRSSTEEPPKTKDRIGCWCLLLAVSATGLAGMAVKRQKNARREAGIQTDITSFP